MVAGRYITQSGIVWGCIGLTKGKLCVEKVL